MSEYIGIALSFLLAGVVAGTMVVLASVLGKKKPSTVKTKWRKSLSSMARAIVSSHRPLVLSSRLYW